MKKIVIIDYQLGNLFSVNRALVEIGLSPIITSDYSEIKNADAVILPGVGAFNNAMTNLNELGLTDAIKNFINTGKPFFGICLGLQLLFAESEEFDKIEGLNIIEGRVLKFRNNLLNQKVKVPQIGWNTINPNRTDAWVNTPLEGLHKDQNMYFVHSYYVSPKDSDISLSVTQYGGINYASSILKDNIFACQFHPEKSAVEGLAIYKNWAFLNKLYK